MSALMAAGLVLFVMTLLVNVVAPPSSPLALRRGDGDLSRR